MEPRWFTPLVVAWMAVAVVVFLSLFKLSAPYGRHSGARVGPQISSRWGWILMEAPAPLGMIAFLALAQRSPGPPSLVLFGLWQLHYLNRAFVYPLRRRDARAMPLLIALSGAGFNVMNAWINAQALFAWGPERGAGGLLSPRFLAGVAVWITGWLVNLRADEVLRNLRREGEGGYRIPQGGLYRFISCPNYFGEILEWCGFALAAFTLPALSFAVWTIANLLPRALSHHRWYRARFPDYPPDRRAVIPLVL
ncbi:MAG TPA: DUF1295 domain-containing protein [Myxococcaceae bacterium]|jgi:hypothetical protein